MQKLQKTVRQLLEASVLAAALLLLTACSVTVSTPTLPGTAPTTPVTRPSNPSQEPSDPTGGNDASGGADKEENGTKDPGQKEDPGSGETPETPPAEDPAPAEQPALLVKNGVLTIGDPEKLTGELTLPSGTAYTIPDRLFRNNESITAVLVPDGVTSIGAGAFQNCTRLTRVELPETLTFLGAGAFLDCKELREVSFPAKMELQMGSSVFQGCGELASVELPEGLKVLPDGTFVDCVNLTHVGLPQSLEAIGRTDGSVFRNCKRLQTVRLPQKLREIKAHAFQETGLTRITLPASVETVGESAFQGNPALHTVEFLGNETARTLDPRAFAFCEALETVILRGKITKLAEEAFGYSESIRTLYLPAGMRNVDEAALDRHAPPETVCFAGSEAEWKALTKDLPGWETLNVRFGQQPPETGLLLAMSALF